ncbi:MAG: phytanoyl-CoA dioxygenase family protein [Actinobacteria bacterium]|nr:phytanoyl-CoA dioxygenase family protein [Actinomycetota bacterium]
MSLDTRTRSDADAQTVDAVRFLDEELPELGRVRGVLAARGARELGAEPFTIETPTGAWTLELAGDDVRVTRGDVGNASVRLFAEDLSDVVNDLKTPMTFVAAGTLSMARGDLGDFLDWWVVLRALVDGRPAHTAGSIAFSERSGAPLDLGRVFTPDDDDAEIAHFLAEAGFVHLQGWYSPALMAEIAEDVDRALPAYTRGDGRSWWARTAGGEDRCVRLQHFDAHSGATASIVDGPALARIAALSGDGHRTPEGENRIEALVKPIGVVEGISDVPWHKDCSLGMHSYRCSSLTVGISVTGADARSGQLRVVPGSHRALVQPAFVRREWGLPVLDLRTETGDVTVHCSCTLHMAQPPVDRERMVLYTGLRLPERPGNMAWDSEARDEIARVREGAHRMVSQPPGHVVPS